MVDGQAGKGDSPRPVDKKKYDRNYDYIFGRKKKIRPQKKKSLSSRPRLIMDKRNKSKDAPQDG